jgi:hypothetical protein
MTLKIHWSHKGPVTLVPITTKDHRRHENARLPETSLFDSPFNVYFQKTIVKQSYNNLRPQVIGGHRLV